MIVLRAQADAQQLDPSPVRSLVERRFAELAADDAESLALFLVLQHGDEAADVAQHLGFSPLENRWDGSRFHEDQFAPSFEVIEEHDDCFEMVFVLGDDGSGVLVFIPKNIETDQELLAMCRQYAVPSQEPSSP